MGDLGDPRRHRDGDQLTSEFVNTAEKMYRRSDGGQMITKMPLPTGIAVSAVTGIVG